MANLEELGLTAERIPVVNLDDMPEQRSEGFYTTPQPGDYTWRLPGDTSAIFEKIATNNGQRVKAKFTGKNSLMSTTGRRLMVDVSNMDGFPDKDGKISNDFAYLLRALGFDGRLDDNEQYVTALSLSAGKLFQAELTWRGKSRATGQVFIPRGYKLTKGPKAGTEYLSIPKIGSVYQDSFEWEGESIRCFPHLKNFRKVE